MQDDGSVNKEEYKRLSNRQKQQVKMQQSMKDQKSRHVVAGPVLITKNPCVHPGDVRKVSTLTNEKDPDRFS